MLHTRGTMDGHDVFADIEGALKDNKEWWKLLWTIEQGNLDLKKRVDRLLTEQRQYKGTLVALALNRDAAEEEVRKLREQLDAAKREFRATKDERNERRRVSHELESENARSCEEEEGLRVALRERKERTDALRASCNALLASCATTEREAKAHEDRLQELKRLVANAKAEAARVRTSHEDLKKKIAGMRGAENAERLRLGAREAEVEAESEEVRRELLAKTRELEDLRNTLAEKNRELRVTETFAKWQCEERVRDSGARIEEARRYADALVREIYTAWTKELERYHSFVSGAATSTAAYHGRQMKTRVRC